MHMKDLQEQLARLTPDQRALLEQRLREKGLTLPSRNEIVPRSPGQPSRLSFAQQRLWFIQRFDSGNTAYNIAAAIRLTGALDAEKLTLSLNEIINRHESLRTGFLQDEAGDPYQAVRPPGYFEVPQRDLSGKQDVEAAARNHLSTLARHPFDLVDPPLRIQLLKLSEDQHILSLITHHIVCDRISVSVFLKELVSLYEGKSLDPMSIQYADWAEWQRNQLQGEQLTKQLDYWKTRLANPLPILELPTTDIPSPGDQIARKTPLRIDRELSQRIKRLAGECHVSLFTFLLATFKLFLHRYSGQHDLVVGSEVANREHPETIRMIGLLVNTLVFRTDIDGAANFEEMLKRVHNTVVGGLEHQDLPFEKLVEELNPTRDTDQLSPLFQVKFDLQPISAAPLTEMSGVRLERFAIEDTQSKYALRFNLQDTDDGIQGQVEYSRGFFADTTIANMIRHYTNILAAVSQNISRPISTYDVIDETERQEILAFSRGPTEAISSTTIHEMISEQALQTPDACAILDHGTSHSYRALEQHSDLIASRLRDAGVQARTLVGVEMRKSFDLVATMIAAWKIGAAYVPLDPNYPEERKTFILADAGIRVVCDDEGIQSLPESEPPPDQNKGNRTADDDGHTVAYLIYTSGSTGHPKGVAIEHRNVTTMIHWARSQNDATDLSGVLASTSICFDLSIFELFVPLACGGSVVLAENLFELDRLPQREQVTLINTVPSVLREYLKDNSLPPSVTTVNLAGEALSRELVSSLQDTNIKQLYNLYGPSEDTTYSTVARLDRNHFDVSRDRVHIGKPIWNTTSYILDEHQRLQPIGVAGELYLGGDGLALGYINRDELTESCFVENPIETSPARLYRTGDRVRLRQDGNLDFLGRKDNQFKIRGYRIEAGEIEAVLREHDQIENALVIADKDDHGEQVLVAYYVEPSEKPRAHQADDEVDAPELNTELQAFIAKRLPSSMVPTLWQRIPEIPKLPNGKVDRHRLPAPIHNIPTTEVSEPENETEAALVEIWKTHLELPHIGTRDNFFALGGHSLLAIRLLTQIESRFGVEIPLRQLFQSPTIQQLANFINETVTVAQFENPSDGTPTVSVDPSNRYSRFPLTDIQQAYWIGRNQSLELGNIATHGYREIDVVGIPHNLIERAFNQLIERHDMLRAVIESDGMQRCLESVRPYEIKLHPSFDSERAAREYCENRRKALSHQVFETDRWPLFHIEAAEVGNGRRRYFVSFDVLLGDAWSLQILGREMAALLIDRNLPPLELTFRDCVLADQAYSEGDRYRASWDFWMEHIQSLPLAPELPLIKRPSEITDPQFTRRTHRIPAETWRAIKGRAKTQGLTESAVVLSAFAEVVGTWSRRRRFTLNLTLFNRPPLHSEVDRIVGDFTSSLLLGINQQPGESFTQRAEYVQSNLWDALEHRAVSGVRVIRELARQRQLSPGALMPVVFTSTLGQNSSSAHHPEWETEVVYGVSQTSQVYFDHQVSELDGELLLNWDCIEELWPPGVLDSMFETYVTLLNSLAENESAWASAAAIPEAGYSSNLINREELSPARNPSSQPRLLHELFFQRAIQQPDQTAIIDGHTTLTYSQLGKRTLQLAEQLISLGAGPNQLIAVALPKGWQQVVACLAIQTAGAAYVPIDVKLPAARRHAIIDDTESNLVITDTAEQDTWPDSLQQIAVPEHEPNDSELYAPAAKQCETDLAYVIYTSGSTGTPKGVMIDHHGAINTLTDINERIKLSSKDRVLALSSLSFDLSVFDIFGTLSAGASLVMPDESSGETNPTAWLELIEQHSVTIWNSVPALMQLALETHEKSSPQRSLKSMRIVMLSGDWIPTSLPPQIKQHCPATHILSLGGATEASIWSIIHPIDEIDSDWPSIPYGRPMSGQTWHVLDEHLNPCPAWVTGELYIGGSGVARGYWNQPALSATRFIPNPFADDPSACLYRTGDLGRIRLRASDAKSKGDALQEGMALIEFQGRDDQQVKINGYRIELGEIESVLAQHSSIENAVATTFGNPPELVAYIVPKNPVGSSQDKLLQRLTSKASQIERNQPSAQPPGIQLPQSENDSTVFRRQTHRQFLTETVSIDELAGLLSPLEAVNPTATPLPKYRYPSAGSLYSVQTYLFVKPNRVEGVEGGWYLYDAQSHQLYEHTADQQANPRDLLSVNQNVFEQSAFSLFFIGSLEIVESMYGDRARDFCLLEAGYIGQLLMEQATTFNLGLCPVNEPGLEELPDALHLKPKQVFLHGLLGGAIDPAWSNQWMAYDESSMPSFDRQLKDHLRSRLPEWMIPRRIVTLEALPLSANGKVDRNDLPIPATAPATEYQPPHTEMEREIVSLWQEVLEIPKVGMQDDFFQLGGNSLQAIRLLTQLREKFAVEVTMAQLFDAQSPVAQSMLVASLQQAPADSTTIERVDRSSQSLDELSDAEVDQKLRELLDEETETSEK